MASGRRSRLAPVLIAFLLAVVSCATGGAATPASTGADAPVTVTQSTTTTTLTTTTTPTTTTVPPASTTTTLSSAEPLDIDADVRVPSGEGPFPAVVLVHGGGWVAGDPSSMTALGEYLTDNGYLTVNVRYRLAAQQPGFPAALDDVACAVGYAASHDSSDGSVALIGHSAGAHLGAVVGLSGDLYGDGCVWDGPRVPSRLVGLAGPYDVERLGVLMLPFFGGGPAVEPEAWLAGNPMNLVGENDSLLSLIMYGDDDALVDSAFAIDFHAALTEAGGRAEIEVVEGARHMDLRHPHWVGDLILAWLER